MKFTDFPTSNESGRVIVSPFWLEHLLNLFYQGYVGEITEEICNTILNHSKTIKNLGYGIIGLNFDKKHLSEEMVK